MYDLNKLSDLVQALQNATYGKAFPFDGQETYLQDVKARIPRIEKALRDLKRYIDSLEEE